MKRRSIVSGIAILLLAITGANAQKGQTKIELSYSTGFPTGSFKDFISDGSYRGMDLRIMHNINAKIAVGFGTGFQDFDQKYPRRVYKLSDGSDVSAIVSNSIQAVPLLARVQYTFNPEKRIRFLAGLGAGGNMVLYRQYLGEFADSKNKFAFQAQPELGVYFPFRPQGASGLSLKAFYNVIPFKYNGMDNLNTFGFSLGIGFPTGS